MIPSIDDIIAGLVSGDCTPEQAKGWIAQHITDAVAEGRTRDLFAAAALEGQLATGIRIHAPAAVAQQCWAYADAMLAAGAAS